MVIGNVGGGVISILNREDSRELVCIEVGLAWSAETVVRKVRAAVALYTTGRGLWGVVCTLLVEKWYLACCRIILLSWPVADS